ncbi:uncharacterized protein LOC123542299 [Mercenaria mercenaria]|uniref:uncharacterized protein LOC123542299 n=1 Tax=Mercenaria mercenaria TaxID=6596 RepID=UPI00234F62B1|nr:uncharacterized protein LOC123542299 [Mercenaria mercenaria]
METKVMRHIPTEEPFRKTWSAPATIISEEDLIQAEMSDNTDGDQIIPNESNSKIETVKSVNPQMPDIRIHSDKPEFQTQNQTHSPEVTFRTPQKVQSEYSKRLQTLNSEVHRSNSSSLLCDKSDWMLAERSHSRSPPSPAIISRSPDLRSRSPMIPISPAVHTNSNIFNFSPERTEMYRAELESESRRVKKRLFEEMAMGPQVPVSCENLTSGYLTSHPSPSHRHRDPYLSPRQLSAREILTRDDQEQEIPHYLRSPSCRNLSSTLYEHERFRAKRRLDVDEEYVSTPKRLKYDLEREMGYRYLQQLESDITMVRNKLSNPETEFKKPSNCTCAIMERQFLEMAESAYRSVRRIDASPRGFEQFRRELIQTNEVMKDSMDVLKNIRAFCEHKC